MLDDGEFKQLIKEYKILDHMKEKGVSCMVKGQHAVRFKKCPVCGGNKSHFLVFTESNTYSSFTKCCRGGDAFNFLLEVVGLNSSDAYKEISKGYVSGSTRTIKPAIDEDKKYLNGLHVFYSALVDAYKYSKAIHDTQENIYSKQYWSLRYKFYEKYVDIFIKSDYYKNYDELIDICKNIEVLHIKEVDKNYEKIKKHL